MLDLEIEKKVRSCLKKLISEKATSISLDTKLISDLGLESIDIIDLLFELEREFSVGFNLSEVFSLKRKEFGQAEQFDLSLYDIVEYLRGILS